MCSPSCHVPPNIESTHFLMASYGTHLWAVFSKLTPRSSRQRDATGGTRFGLRLYEGSKNNPSYPMAKWIQVLFIFIRLNLLLLSCLCPTACWHALYLASFEVHVHYFFFSSCFYRLFESKQSAVGIIGITTVSCS